MHASHLRVRGQEHAVDHKRLDEVKVRPVAVDHESQRGRQNLLLHEGGVGIGQTDSRHRAAPTGVGCDLTEPRVACCIARRQAVEAARCAAAQLVVVGPRHNSASESARPHGDESDNSSEPTHPGSPVVDGPAAYEHAADHNVVVMADCPQAKRRRVVNLRSSEMCKQCHGL